MIKNKETDIGVANPYDLFAEALFERYQKEYGELSVNAVKAGFPALQNPLEKIRREERVRLRKEISQALWNKDGSLKSHNLSHVVSTAIHKTLDCNSN